MWALRASRRSSTLRYPDTDQSLHADSYRGGDAGTRADIRRHQHGVERQDRRLGNESRSALMPYDRERAGKGGHADFVRNPDVQGFLEKCAYLREPSDAEAQELVSRFMAAPMLNGNSLTLVGCPCCGAKPGPTFDVNTLVRPCEACGAETYATDFLRLHEGISDFGDNASAMTRMMNAVEHLMLAGFILQVFEAQPLRAGWSVGHFR